MVCWSSRDENRPFSIWVVTKSAPKRSNSFSRSSKGSSRPRHSALPMNMATVKFGPRSSATHRSTSRPSRNTAPPEFRGHFRLPEFILSTAYRTMKWARSIAVVCSIGSINRCCVFRKKDGFDTSRRRLFFVADILQHLGQLFALDFTKRATRNGFDHKNLVNIVLVLGV